ncbi:glutathione S-transferase family protein [Phenylobacterium sp. 58.2.17]|uniref:glutathione S-transferase family protein n=1 Tax=Phenylobacterium sp. 58.2.17 TaxID=2969306 RepID=UPI002263E317|nr:glutathione S-transferase family protein [Phenylobacterium sp. 58.2.17]MCX7586426.1 glutathione S-transferase family protein [Phenylobacterium sp. 58.2.17]
MSLVLHFHPLSSYCHKVLIGLYERGTPFEARVVDFSQPQAREQFEALWPTAKIPLLVDGDRAVPETSIQLEYLDAHYPGPSMLPAEPEARLEARLWDRVFDQYVMTPMQKIVADRLRAEGEKDPRGVANAREMLAMAYGLIDGHMAGRSWAAGEAFSLADCAAAPALFYAGIVAPWGEEQGALGAYFERLVARPSVARTLAEARPFFEYFPYRELMPARFLEGA